MNSTYILCVCVVKIWDWYLISVAIATAASWHEQKHSSPCTRKSEKWKANRIESESILGEWLIRSLNSKCFSVLTAHTDYGIVWNAHGQCAVHNVLGWQRTCRCPRAFAQKHSRFVLRCYDRMIVNGYKMCGLWHHRTRWPQVCTFDIDNKAVQLLAERCTRGNRWEKLRKTSSWVYLSMKSWNWRESN